MTTQTTITNSVVVGRQPILDRGLCTVGYELLFRSSDAALNAAFVDGDAATAQVISHALADIGLDNLIGDKRAFINVTSRFLTDHHMLEFLPPDRVVLEVLEDVTPTPAVLDGVHRLIELGYTVALDDFTPRGLTAPLRDLASIIKYDFSVTSGDELRHEIECDHAAGRRVVVERVETREDHTEVAAAGADLFQGYFFARPRIVAGASIPQNTGALIRLLAAINEPATPLSTIVEMLTQDVAMSVKILRVVNSAGHGLGTRVTSIQHAAILIGRARLRSWATLLIMSSFDDKPAALVSMSLTRAKFCELYAFAHGAEAPLSFFAVGMLSLLDVMTDTPMASVLNQLPLSDEMRASLLGKDGPMADALRLAIQLEQPIRPNSAPPFDSVTLDHYRESLSWANSITSTTLG
ncbi:MAG: EAL and HDOD domain-containing protein [Ilumatobacter sp.]